MKLDHHANRVRACTVVQAMSQATQHMLSSVWASGGGARDVYADYNELTLSITTNALFGVDMTSRQSAGISGKLYMDQLYMVHAVPDHACSLHQYDAQQIGVCAAIDKTSC